MKSKILCIGDIHLKSKLGCSNLVEDGREEEQKEVLDFIIKESEDCSKIVFLGDQLDKKDNPSQVIKLFVAFLEQFKEKEIYIISGNHERMNNGKTALDFLAEVKNKRWTIITKGIKKIGDYTFLPYLTKADLGVNTNEEGAKKILKELKENKILFTHYAISNTSINNVNVDFFDEVILPRKELELKFQKVVAGHIHTPSLIKNTLITGSIFNTEINERNKSIWKIDEDTLEIEAVALPGRGIYKLVNPTKEELTNIPKKSIIKVIITKNSFKIEDMKKELKRFDGHLILKQIPRQRKEIALKGDKQIIDMSVKELLEIYSKEQKVDYKKLSYGFSLLQ